jgi:hypothetical protein
MAQATTDKKPKPSSARHGIPSSEQELKESEKCWADMEACFKQLYGSKKKQ